MHFNGIFFKPYLTNIHPKDYRPIRPALVRSSVLGLAPRGVQGMYGHFTAVAQLLSPRGAGPTFGEGDLSDF